MHTTNYGVLRMYFFELCIYILEYASYKYIKIRIN